MGQQYFMQIVLCEAKHLRFGICQIFYTSKIKNFPNFIREKRANCDIFGQQLRKEDVLLINFEQFFSFCVIFSFLLKYKLTPVVLWKL